MTTRPLRGVAAGGVAGAGRRPVRRAAPAHPGGGTARVRRRLLRRPDARQRRRGRPGHLLRDAHGSDGHAYRDGRPDRAGAARLAGDGAAVPASGSACQGDRLPGSPQPRPVDPRRRPGLERRRVRRPRDCHSSSASGRTEETIDLLRRLWTGERVTFHGRYFDIEDVAIAPTPRPPGPPLWLGSFLPARPELDTIPAKLDRVLARIGRMADGWVPGGVLPAGEALGHTAGAGRGLGAGQGARGDGRTARPRRSGVLALVPRHRERRRRAGGPGRPGRVFQRHLRAGAGRRTSSARRTRSRRRSRPC